MTKLTFYNSKVVRENKKNISNQTIINKINNFKFGDMLPHHLHDLLLNLNDEINSELEEIRLRINRPLIIRVGKEEFTLTKEGRVTKDILDGYYVTASDIARSLQIISQSSVYALEEEFRNGFITIKGGYRVGLVGRAVVEKGKVKTLKDISGLNYRISRELIGIGSKVFPYLVDGLSQKIFSTLIISPPQCGKTTLLRDLIRIISNGESSLCWQGANIGVVDERSEIAACYHGVPQFNVGLRTDILDGCPKAEGMIMLIRSMSPLVIATDEIGRLEDVFAIEEAIRAGVSVLTTVHGDSYEEVLQRPNIKPLLEEKVFQRIIVMSRSLGVGTVEKIIKGKELLNSRAFRCS